jgi:hypothetical protein
MKWSTLFLFFLVLGCKSPAPVTGRAFYFWRTVFSFQSNEQKELLQLGVQRLYTRFFDVDYEETLKEAKPIADIRFGTTVDSLLEIVPVVFITNRALLESNDSAMETLGLRITGRITGIEHSLVGQHLKEVQIDCDWTESTREKYFKLLDAVKAEFRKFPVLVSATIRLHQIKYFRRTGVPPVDRGMLMFYNMGKLDDEKTSNSIYDERTAASYIQGISDYPLPLDMALPCFSWAVISQNGHVCHLINDVTEAELNGVAGLRRTDKVHYRVDRQTRLRNIELSEEQTMRLEQVDAEQCKEAARQIESVLKHAPVYVAIFHLSKNKYTVHEKQAFEGVFNRFD